MMSKCQYWCTYVASARYVLGACDSDQRASKSTIQHVIEGQRDDRHMVADLQPKGSRKLGRAKERRVGTGLVKTLFRLCLYYGFDGFIKKEINSIE